MNSAKEGTMIRTLPCAVIAILSIGAAAASEPNPQATGQNPGATAPVATQPGAGEPSKTAAPLVEHSEPVHEERGYVFGDYLLWWVRRGPTPPLVTTAAADSLSQGTLDNSGETTILFGNHGVDFGTFSGIRVGAGWNFGPEAFWAIELGGFLLQDRHKKFTAASDAASNSLLVQPFLSSLDTLESGVAVASPGQLAGSIRIDSDIRLWGYEVNLVAHSIRDRNRRFDLLGGFRGLDHQESLQSEERFTVLDDNVLIFQKPPVGGIPGPNGDNIANNIINPPKGSRVDILDQFDTRNRFYGGQLGGRFQWNFGRLDVDLLGKLAAGVTRQHVTIFGVSTLDQPNQVTPGGVFAQTSNIGTFERSQFAFVPEIGVNAAWNITNHVRARIGYSALYWSAVARPGDMIDRNINPKLIPTGQDFDKAFNPAAEQRRPVFQFQDNGFWAHGLNFGVEFHY